jgi:hypothetical protein
MMANYIGKQLIGDRTQPSLIKQLNIQKQYFDGAFREINTYLTQRRTSTVPETDEIDLKNISFEELLRRSERWHEELAQFQTGNIETETGNIVKVYKDGYYWINLEKSFCAQEKNAMGHCGNGQGTLFSLRKAKHPFLTADVSHGNLIQLRGRANTKPKPEYHKYIIDFIMNPEVGIVSMNPSTYRPLQNFELKDLSLEDIKKLYLAKPRMFVADELYKVLLKYPEFAYDVNLRQTPLHEHNKEDLKRRHPEMANLFV